MRRIDAIAITAGFFAAGGIAFWALRAYGVEVQNAGIWSQLVLVVGLLGWLSTYLFRVVTHRMTYDRQLEAYKVAVLQKRLEEMSPEEIARLQAEVTQNSQQLVE